MNRVQVDTSDLDERLLTVAVALARFLNQHCPADPNPSGGHASQARKTVRSNDEPSLPLIPDQEYTLPQAAEITRYAVVTLRKMLRMGRLTSRLEKGQHFISGKVLAQLMSRQEANGAASPPDEA